MDKITKIRWKGEGGGAISQKNVVTLVVMFAVFFLDPVLAEVKAGHESPLTG
jgi:hypothetical protein